VAKRTFFKGEQEQDHLEISRFNGSLISKLRGRKYGCSFLFSKEQSDIKGGKRVGAFGVTIKMK